MVSLHRSLFCGGLFRQHGSPFYPWRFRRPIPLAIFTPARYRAFFSHDQCFMGLFQFAGRLCIIKGQQDLFAEQVGADRSICGYCRHVGEPELCFYGKDENISLDRAGHRRPPCNLKFYCASNLKPAFLSNHINQL